MRNEAKHVPLTRQRSAWEHSHNDAILDVTTHWFRRYVHDGMLWACLAHEPQGWHLSISFRSHHGEPTRYPSWDEQVHALREVGPRGITWAMYLPPDDEGYVSLHPTTFHWHEAKGPGEQP